MIFLSWMEVRGDGRLEKSDKREDEGIQKNRGWEKKREDKR